MAKKPLSEAERVEIEDMVDNPDEMEKYLLQKGVSPYVVHQLGLLWLEIENIRDEFEGHSHREEIVDKIVPK